MLGEGRIGSWVWAVLLIGGVVGGAGTVLSEGGIPPRMQPGGVGVPVQAREDVGGDTEAGSHREHSEDHEGQLGQIGEVLGFLTGTLLIGTISLGVLRRINPRRLLKIHKVCGVATLLSALCHATIMLLR